ncbi:hypothetical protein DFA_09581 [Cavenderia fasciculata]|uniref:Uncharacterized protein n=1 Tax=Cavenderia fasciculata TaxID=261658 RepID=F4Q811_CACFS|nr:uncharacterized protein DFA_09581 [Cavenderia fasciculata]EGG15911.1 hypothetical protein DFA_09581 [Cavenderia fasciculata]|eukprot:XP_004352236.1 hypothetical protein DFA_09581 [Cavenderia fasciculata]
MYLSSSHASMILQTPSQGNAYWETVAEAKAGTFIFSGHSVNTIKSFKLMQDARYIGQTITISIYAGGLAHYSLEVENIWRNNNMNTLQHSGVRLCSTERDVYFNIRSVIGNGVAGDLFLNIQVTPKLASYSQSMGYNNHWVQKAFSHEGQLIQTTLPFNASQTIDIQITQTFNSSRHYITVAMNGTGPFNYNVPNLSLTNVNTDGNSMSFQTCSPDKMVPLSVQNLDTAKPISLTISVAVDPNHSCGPQDAPLYSPPPLLVVQSNSSSRSTLSTTLLFIIPSLSEAIAVHRLWKQATTQNNPTCLTLYNKIHDQRPYNIYKNDELNFKKQKDVKIKSSSHNCDLILINPSVKNESLGSKMIRYRRSPTKCKIKMEKCKEIKSRCTIELKNNSFPVLSYREE